MHSHHTRTILEKGEDAEETPPPVPPAHIDKDRIVGMGSTDEDTGSSDDEQGSASATASARMVLARDASVRVAKDVTQSVSKTVGDTVKTIDERLHVSEKLDGTKTALGEMTSTVSTKTTEVSADVASKIQPTLDGTRQSLSVAAKSVGESVRNLDGRLKVSATVGKIAPRVVMPSSGDGADGGSSIVANPWDILRAEATVAQTLTVSDQHVTILLTHAVAGDDADDGKDELSIDYRADDKPATADAAEKDQEEQAKPPKMVKSLLKLTVVPFHREAFNHTLPSVPGSSDGPAPGTYTSFSALNESDERNSRDILSFLSDYTFHLTSESGAEYSYWNASPGGRFHFIGAAGQIIAKPIGNLIGRLGKKKEDGADGNAADDAASAAPSEASQWQSIKSSVRTKAGSFTVELISPATDRQIQRASPSPSMVLIEETPEMYEAVTKPHIEAIVAGGSLSWLKNIIDGTKESERLLYDHEEYIVNIDTKWRSHPDPRTVPREEWLHHPSTADLYCLGIFKADGVACLRDLRVEHLPTLQSMVADGVGAIERTYGIPRDQIRCFVHYQPQFMHFHVHYTRLQNEIGCQVERGHLVSDVIQNLEMDPLYYTKRTVTYKLKVTDQLYGKIADYQKGGAEEESDVGV